MSSRSEGAWNLLKARFFNRLLDPREDAMARTARHAGVLDSTSSTAGDALYYRGYRRPQ